MTQLLSARAHVGLSRTSLRQAQASLFHCAFLGAFATMSLSSSTSAQTVAFAATDGGDVQLDRFQVSADKENAFSLPLDATVRTGSRLGLANRDLPASVSVITQEAIQLRGARTALESIESAVGMTGQVGVGSIPTYSTRGFGSNDVTIMRDGIRQNTASQSARPLDAFLFDRIEVLKGPASLLYGEGAVGGAVNYVTKLPDKVARGEAIASIGSWNSARYGLGLGGPLGDQPLAYRFDASYQKNDGYVQGSGSEFIGLSGALRWDASPTTTLTFTGTFLKDNVDSYYGTPIVYDAVVNTTISNAVPEIRKANTATDRLINARVDPGTVRLNYNEIDNFSDTENSFWRLIADTKLTPDWTLRNELYLATQLLTWRNTESILWNPVTQLVDRSGFLLIYRDDVQWGDRVDFTWDHAIAGRPNKLLLGGLYDHNDQIRNSGQPNVPASPTPASVTLLNPDRGYGPAIRYQKTADIVVKDLAFYLEDVYEPVAGLKLIGGLRWERIDTTRVSLIGVAPFSKRYSPVTGRFGAVWSVTPTTNVYASYSRAAQPVSQLVSLTVAQNDFALQKGRQFEVGSKSTFWHEKVDVTLALYDIKKNDILTSTLDSNGVRINQQIGAQVSQGGEFALAISPTREWRIEANFAYTWKMEFQDFFENLGTGVISRAGNLPTYQPKVVEGLFVSRSLDKWLFTSGVRHVGRRAANTNNSIWLDAYTTLDASVGYTYGKSTLTLRGRNLTNELYAANGSTLQLLSQPRSVEVALRQTF